MIDVMAISQALKWADLPDLPEAVRVTTRRPSIDDEVVSPISPLLPVNALLTGSPRIPTVQGRLEATLHNGINLLRQDVSDLTLHRATMQANPPVPLQIAPQAKGTAPNHPNRTEGALPATTPTIVPRPALPQLSTKTPAVRQAPRIHRLVTVLIGLRTTAVVVAALVFGFLRSSGRTNVGIHLMQATVHPQNIHNLYGPSTTHLVQITRNLSNQYTLLVEELPLNGVKPIGKAIHLVRILSIPLSAIPINTTSVNL